MKKIPEEIQHYFQQVKLPSPGSHKGENGKLLLIGGSQLFHAASKWSLDVASKFVDMVFYASVENNNALIQQAKADFWNGIVISRDDIHSYIQESDCILIGPGMERNSETQQLVNDLLERYGEKKWVIDAGALQMVNPLLLNENHILTPHKKEMESLEQRVVANRLSIDSLQTTILLKGVTDKVIFYSNLAEKKSSMKNEVQIIGGNAGMTKGGTGDVLAGLVAALYCRHSAFVAAIVGSYVNKMAGDELYKSVGPFYNASDLVEQVPKTFWELLSKE